MLYFCHNPQIRKSVICKLLLLLRVMSSLSFYDNCQSRLLVRKRPTLMFRKAEAILQLLGTLAVIINLEMHSLALFTKKFFVELFSNFFHSNYCNLFCSTTPISNSWRLISWLLKIYRLCTVWHECKIVHWMQPNPDSNLSLSQIFYLIDIVNCTSCFFLLVRRPYRNG
jgi:hypothetical protein